SRLWATCDASHPTTRASAWQAAKRLQDLRGLTATAKSAAESFFQFPKKLVLTPSEAGGQHAHASSSLGVPSQNTWPSSRRVTATERFVRTTENLFGKFALRIPERKDERK